MQPVFVSFLSRCFRVICLDDCPAQLDDIVKHRGLVIRPYTGFAVGADEAKFEAFADVSGAQMSMPSLSHRIASADVRTRKVMNTAGMYGK